MTNEERTTEGEGPGKGLTTTYMKRTQNARISACETRATSGKKLTMCEWSEITNVGADHPDQKKHCDNQPDMLPSK